MKNLIIILVLVGALFVLKYINPTFEDHQSSISTEIQLNSPLWDNLEYKDYFVASFTSDIKKGSMVSLGFCKYIKVVDDEWGAEQGE